MLVFPEGIRLAKSYEIPNSVDKEALLVKIDSARIEEGYILQTVENSLFSCYAEANIDAPQIWKVFRSLCEALLPDEAMPIIGEIDEEPLHNGEYDRREKLLELFEPYQFYLTNDCYVQFGLAAETETKFEEVFVTATKHFQIWTNKPHAIEKVMGQYGIPKKKELQFIDKFPRTTEALKYDNGFYSYEDLINHLVELTGEVTNE